MMNSRQREADRRQFAPSCRRQDESAGQSLGQRRTERSPNPSCANYGQLVGSCRLYGVPVVVTSDAELARVRRTHQLRAYRIGSVLRIGVVLFMVAAMLVGTPRREWGAQTALICVYAFAALWALALAFRRSRPMVSLDRFANIARYEPLAFTAVDVLALTGFQLLSTDGIYSLLIMTLLPVLVALDISSRRAAVVLALTLVGFGLALAQDPVVIRMNGWPEAIFRFGLYAFLCATALMVVRSEERHARSVATLSVIREELLAQTMTASEVLQRRISESIHDGPLQDVLAARQELIELRAAAPHDQRVSTALAGLQSASDLLRQATFELHPAVLEQVGLGAAVEQLASFHAQRSGIRITDDVDYPIRDEIDPIVFGVARELLSNVVQHSRARNASVALGISDGVCVLDVADDGVGVSGETMARRLGQGHIGLASHRARVDAAGGSLVFLNTPTGTHVCVRIPLKG
ncbi:two component sensor kinase [Mycobacterium ulcerans Agy99]|uniref:Two component sensor kinase n=1 Tax=Mycobacterium ulcerans (strain Agy99) TaxID=362242 RepID=A0PL55_MYCUA|nr:two component sensor kinase [Mycobacterium ulcerans Agy99]